MRARLILPGKVQINIRNFVSLEAKECGKRYIQAFLLHPGTALRTFFFRHVISDIVLSRFRRPLKMSALRTDVMRCERIYFCYPRHGSGK